MLAPYPYPRYPSYVPRPLKKKKRYQVIHRTTILNLNWKPGEYDENTGVRFDAAQLFKDAIGTQGVIKVKNMTLSFAFSCDPDYMHGVEAGEMPPCSSAFIIYIPKNTRPEDLIFYEDGYYFQPTQNVIAARTVGIMNGINHTLSTKLSRNLNAGDNIIFGISSYAPSVSELKIEQAYSVFCIFSAAVCYN